MIETEMLSVTGVIDTKKVRAWGSKVRINQSPETVTLVSYTIRSRHLIPTV